MKPPNWSHPDRDYLAGVRFGICVTLCLQGSGLIVGFAAAKIWSLL